MHDVGHFSQRLLVDFDCLFDTRIGWLRLHHPEELKKLLPAAYYHRFTDAWADVIGVKDFPTRFAKRGKEVLRHSMPTTFLEVLGARLEGLLLQIQLASPIERPRLTINMYPYVGLTGPELDTFERMFRDYYDMVNLDIVCEAPEKLTPATMLSRWDGYFVWDWYTWIAANAKHFEHVRMPGFTVFRVAMFTPELTPEVIEQLQNGDKNPFDEARRELAELLSLDTVDSALLSLDPRHQDEVFGVRSP